MEHSQDKSNGEQDQLQQAGVSGSYLFKYRSMGKLLQVEIKKTTMAEAIQFFGRYYHGVDEILWAGWVHS